MQENQGNKCVFVLDEALPPGLAANTAAVLALTLGSKVESLLGPDVFDGSGQRHVGITTVTLPMLRADVETIQRIRDRAVETEGVLVVDFNDVAQRNKTYQDYIQQLGETPASQLRYLGLALYGLRASITKLTGSLPLLR
ncbi:MAG TPA: DUF2000 domain-containing protein [Ktedonobacterales bacterium]|jgi:hypothetical protein